MTLIFLSIIGSFYALWIFYLAVMCLKRARDSGSISTGALCFGYPILFVGMVIDFVVQVTAASVLFLEPPRELTVTARLKRHLYHGKPGSWREKLAGWLCANLLNTFDPDGRHC